MRIRKLFESSLRILFFSGLSIWTATLSHVSAANREIRNVQLMSAGQAHLTVDAPTDHSYHFLLSTNLPDWKPAGPLAPVSFDGQTATYLLEIDPEKPLATYQVEYQPTPPNPTPIAQLDAPADEPVIQHLPDMRMPFEDEAEVEVIDGVLPVSMASILVTFDDSLTIQTLNDILSTENLSVAGTVPTMNLLLLRRNEVTNLEDLSQLIERLRNNGAFDAAGPNIALSEPGPAGTPIPGLNWTGGQSPTLGWEWDAFNLGEGLGGNNAFEMSRIPQLWNWLDYGYRQRDALGGHTIAVIESAFNPHNDLEPAVLLDPPLRPGLGQSTFDHGVGVMGIIAANHDSKGIQGVTPFPYLIHGIALSSPSDRRHWVTDKLELLANELGGPNPPKIVNISRGMPYYRLGEPTETNVVPGQTYAEWMDHLGLVWSRCFERLHRHIPNTDYLIVCSAGNDAGVDARYSSPMANVACRQELNSRTPQFITVENVQSDRRGSSGSNYDISGVGASVSAGGTDVRLLSGPLRTHYTVNSGTSFSAPLVSGLASFLWSLEPSLTISEMKTLLVHSNLTFQVQGGERGNLVDGFSAALAIDALRQSPDLQRALVDVDDGTLDGNLREEIVSFSEDPDLIHTADGRRGDGVVNMKDFRVFRDAWLHVNGETGNLDGPPTHFKRDLNYDGLVNDQIASPGHPAPYTIAAQTGQSLEEAIYSRYDYNGNGLLDADAQSGFPPVESISPFKTDPDTPVTGRSLSKGLYRDIDVLFHKDVWQQDEENVVLEDAPPYPTTLPVEWTTNNMTTLFVSYLQSFDFHIDMEGGNPDAANDNYNEHVFFPAKEGLEIRSFFMLNKGRSGEWEGVVTIPYDLIGDIPLVSAHYRKTQSGELHQYIINFLPEKGEDLALVVAFDDLQFYSNTRNFASYFIEGSNNPESTEVIVKTPGSGTYGGFFIPIEEATQQEIKDRARDAAISALASQLKFPVALNGSPAFEAIYDTDGQEGGTFVEIYGIRATYNTIEGTPVQTGP